jgi:hypothetical protein
VLWVIKLAALIPSRWTNTEKKRAQARQQAGLDAKAGAKPTGAEVLPLSPNLSSILIFPRTHRERKEMYIKALEQEVLRLKETFADTAKERDAFAEENRRLKELLMAHGIQYDLGSPNGMARFTNSSYGGSSSGSVSGGYGTGTNSTGYTSPPTMAHRSSISHEMPMSQLQQAPPPNSGMDYDQIGIDFVLTYDRTPYLSPPPQQ